VARYARPVAYLHKADGTGGTGFLVGPDLLLTNHHVLSSPADAEGCTVWFNFNVGSAGYPSGVCGEPRGACAYACSTGGHTGLFVASPHLEVGVDEDHLDYALVRVDKQLSNGQWVDALPGDTWGYVPVVGSPFDDLNIDLTIIQHPGQAPTFMAQGQGQLRYKSDLIVQYVTDTDYGSSGSPVFNMNWELVGLHHANVTLPKGMKGNEGIRIAAILNDLKVRAPVLALPVAKTNKKGWPVWP